MTNWPSPQGMIYRPPPQNKFEFFERGWRIALAWVCIVLVMVPLCVCAAVIMVAFTLGVLKSIETGQPLPDLTAGWDRVLPSIMPYIGPGLAGLFALMLSRHREVNTAIAAGGGSGRPPFDQSSARPSASDPPTPDGGLVNNEALRGDQS